MWSTRTAVFILQEGGRVLGRPATLTVCRKRMSAEDPPIISSKSPGSTTLVVPATVKLNRSVGSRKVTRFRPPGSRASLWKPSSSRTGRTRLASRSRT